MVIQYYFDKRFSFAYFKAIPRQEPNIEFLTGNNTVICLL